jgi:hypothetical protein
MFRSSDLKSAGSKSSRRIRAIVAVAALALGAGLSLHTPAASADSTGCDRVVQISIRCDPSVIVVEKPEVKPTTTEPVSADTNGNGKDGSPVESGEQQG